MTRSAVPTGLLPLPAYSAPTISVEAGDEFEMTLVDRGTITVGSCETFERVVMPLANVEYGASLLVTLTQVPANVAARAEGTPSWSMTAVLFPRKYTTPATRRRAKRFVPLP